MKKPWPLLPLMAAAFCTLSACHSTADAMREAIDAGDSAAVQAIARGEDTAWKHESVERGAYCYSLLEYAARYGRVEDVEQMLEQGARPGYSAWSGAVMRDSLPIVRAMKEHAETPLGISGLLRIAQSAEMVNYLMDHGADPLEMTEHPYLSGTYYPLCHPANDAAFKAMVERVGWRNIPQQAQTSILQHAVFREDKEERLRFLTEQGLDVTMKLDGKSLVEYARGLIPFEGIVVPRAMKCEQLLKGLSGS